MNGNPEEMDLLEREELEARERLAEERAKHFQTGGVTPSKEHPRLRELEDEWQRAAERLHHARQTSVH